jgi:hypothetical protein
MFYLDMKHRAADERNVYPTSEVHMAALGGHLCTPGVPNNGQSESTEATLETATNTGRTDSICVRGKRAEHVLLLQVIAHRLNRNRCKGNLTRENISCEGKADGVLGEVTCENKGC